MTLRSVTPKARRPLLLLLAAFAVLGAAFHSAVPLFEGPDEPSHLHYSLFISRHGRLPRYSEQAEVPGQGVQPPLYYMLTSPLAGLVVKEPDALLSDLWHVNRMMYRYDRLGMLNSRRIRLHEPPGERGKPRIFAEDPNLAHLKRLRWLNLLFGLAAVALTFFAALRLSGDPGLAALAGGLMAFNPQFLFISSYMNNDALSAVIGAASFLLVAVAFDRRSRAGPRRAYLALGALTGLGLLTKLTTVPGLGVAGLTLLLADDRPWRRRLPDAGLAVLCALALAGPYIVWSSRLSGSLYGLEIQGRDFGQMVTHAEFGGLGRYLGSIYWDWTFQSYWAWFGWLTLKAPKLVILAFFAMTLTGVIGLLLPGRRRGDLRNRTVKFYLAAVVLVTLAGHLAANIKTPSPQGRHMFAAAPQISFLLAAGLARIAGARERGMQRHTVALLLGVPVLLSLYCLLGVLIPAYR